ncbi:hypothetical protein B4N84_16305 [Flavobacterium sp. IR1]|nr:hypothetical protein B4N84_16305 [Flavobacterium sp. IR1]
MKHLKITIIFILVVVMISCKKENNGITLISTTTDSIKINTSKISVVKLNLHDTVINRIDSTKIRNVEIDKEKIIELYYKSFEKDYIKPITNFDGIKTGRVKIGIKKYADFYINQKEFKSYLISFDYENDRLYRAILLANNSLDDGLIVYEKYVNEGEYIRTSKVKDNIITNSIFTIEYYEYDRNGDISGHLEKKDTTLIIKNKYCIRDNYFSEYFKKDNLEISKEWGDKEVIYTKDGLDSSYVSLYNMKGKVQNHVKNGDWEERKYIMEYDKSCWVNGKYVNGLKDGEWYYSPNGPVDKTEVYDMGKLLRTY